MSPRTVDALLAAGVTAVLTVVVSANQAPDRPFSPTAYLWAVGLGGLMLVRRRHPLLVLELTTLGFFSYYALGFPAIGVGVPMAAALLSAAEMGYTRVAVATGAAVLAATTAFRLAVGQNPALVLAYELPAQGALVGGFIALGHSVRVSRCLRQRSAQVARLLDLQSEMDARVRVREERLQLARELHDSIGHHLSIAHIYAGLARDTDPALRRHGEALQRVRDAVSDALRELRGTVSVLRTKSEGAPLEAPRIEHLPSLTAAPSAAGFEIDLDVRAVRASPEAESATYRLVQEAITNTLRHSNGSHIAVTVDEPTPGILNVVVRDDGRGPRNRDIHAGHGLAGMRERVSDLGGTFDVRADAAGWRVEATIPTGVPT
jgi:signal transduction histidine kinase